MSAALDPIPQSDPLIDESQHMGERWYRWLSAFVTRCLTAILRVAAVHRSGLSSSQSATTIYTPNQTGLIWRVNWAVRVTTAAAVSSSIAVTINWTEGGVACSKAFAALTGNTTATADGDSVVIRSDVQPIRYATTYASNPAGVMVYELDVVVEDLT